MGLCEQCRFNKNKYCTYFNSSTVIANGMTSCTAYKKNIAKTTNNIKKKSIKQEKRLAKDIGAKRTPQSGASATSPSDMITGNYIIESKATKGKSISVKETWLSSLRESPMHLGQIPTLVLEFLGRRRYVVMAEDDFKRLMEENNDPSNS